MGTSFDDLYARDDDPWALADRWSERRKRDLSVAVLPRARYRAAFEPGCSIGLLTERLAERCDEVLATDVADRAVALARQRCARRPGVRVQRGSIPVDWPARPASSPFDLVVLSEVLYFLDVDGVVDVLDRSRASLAVGGHLLAVHYRPPADLHVLDGDVVHDLLRGAPGFSTVVHHTEPLVRVDVLERSDDEVAQT